MKNLLTLTFILLIPFVFISCSDDTPTSGGQVLDTSSFTYPTSIGSSWNTKRVFSAENIRPDSIRHYFTEWPYIFYGSVSIAYDTTINGTSTKCFVETEIEDSATFQCRLYYQQTDSGLYCIAARDFAILGMPFKKNPDVMFSKNGAKNSNPFQLMHSLLAPESPDQDSLMIYNPPLLSIKYPVKKGTQWQFSDFSYPVTKKYIDFVSITIGNKLISCIKTEIKYVGFDDIIYYEYYSKYGEVKSDCLYKNMLVTTQWNPEGAGYVDMRQVINVTTYSIVNP